MPYVYMHIPQRFQWGILWNKEGQMGTVLSSNWEKTHEELNMLACNEKEIL